MKKSTITDAVRELADTGLSAKEIAKRTGASPSTVQTYLSRFKKPQHYQDVRNAWWRRTHGRPSRAEALSARRLEQAKRWEAARPLLDRGMTFSQVAAKLGTTRNVVAGLSFRMRKREGAAA